MMRLVRCVDRASRAVRSRDRVIPAPRARPAACGPLRSTMRRCDARVRPTVNTGVPTPSRLDPPLRAAPRPSNPMRRPHAALPDDPHLRPGRGSVVRAVWLSSANDE